MVQRYDMADEYSGLLPWGDDGDWVRSEDYDAAQARVAELEAECAGLHYAAGRCEASAAEAAGERDEALARVAELEAERERMIEERNPDSDAVFVLVSDHRALMAELETELERAQGRARREHSRGNGYMLVAGEVDDMAHGLRARIVELEKERDQWRQAAEATTPGAIDRLVAAVATTQEKRIAELVRENGRLRAERDDYECDFAPAPGCSCNRCTARRATPNA